MRLPCQGELTTDGSGTTHSFDANGNRTDPGYVTGPDNQLLSDGTYNYAYDADGNEASKTNIATGEKWAYRYDASDHLIKAVETTAAGTVEVEVDYHYDVFGNRVEMDAWTAALGQTVQKYAYDGWDPAKGTPVGNENWDVWADLNADGSLQTRYLRGDGVDQLDVRIGSDGYVYWYLTDRQGSIRAVVQGDGQVVDALSYDGYGNITSQTDPAFRGRYAWTGREFDTETNLQYNHARYYAAATGRWISQDPKRFAAGDSNLYRYVAHRPTVETDPSGLQYGPDGRWVGPGPAPYPGSSLNKQPRPSASEIEAVFQAQKKAKAAVEAAKPSDPAALSPYVLDLTVPPATKPDSCFDAILNKGPKGQANPPFTGFVLRDPTLPEIAAGAGKLAYNVVDNALEPIRMGGDLMRSGGVLVVVVFGGDPYPPDYRSNLAKETTANPNNIGPTIINAEIEHAKDSAIALVTFGVMKGGNKLLNKALGSSGTGLASPAVVRTGAFLEGTPGFAERGLGVLTNRQIVVTEAGIARIEQHLARPIFVADAANTAMLARLRNALANGGRVSGADASYYLHEIYESTLMNRGVLYEVAHPAALNRYGVSAFSVYHPDVILTTPGFNEHWIDFWREMARRGVNP